MGPTSANFRLVGNLHWLRELLTMLNKGAEIAEAAALISLGGSPSQPVAFFVLSLLSIVSTSLGLTLVFWMLSKELHTWMVIM